MLTVEEILQLKELIKNELSRRNGYGDISKYGSVAYDFIPDVDEPYHGGIMDAVHMQKTKDLMLAITDFNTDINNLTESNDIILDAIDNTLLDIVNEWMGEEDYSSCRGACTGLCVGTCISSCSGCSEDVMEDAQYLVVIVPAVVEFLVENALIVVVQHVEKLVLKLVLIVLAHAQDVLVAVWDVRMVVHLVVIQVVARVVLINVMDYVELIALVAVLDVMIYV